MNFKFILSKYNFFEQILRNYYSHCGLEVLLYVLSNTIF